MDKVFVLGHLFTTVFLYCFADYLVVPAITDVTMAALCPEDDKCSLAIYLTGAQQAIVGLGSLVVMPLIGNLSDTYGRKVMLTVPMALSTFPLLILAYRRTKNYFYVYYVIKTLVSMTSEGSVQFLALAYVADNVPKKKRAAVFGMIAGFTYSSFVLGNFCARFIPTSSTFQVASAVSVMALVYMRLFLPESSSLYTQNSQLDYLLEELSTKKWQLFETLPSLDSTICFLKTSPTFSKAAMIAFFLHFAEVGLYDHLMYYLKARFKFQKDQFADLMVIAGIGGALSQLILVPIIAPIVREEKLLSIGLFFSSAHMILYSVAWSPWVPYGAAMISVVASFAMPCLKSIASKEVGPSEQGRAQGCISGICSFSSIVSPLVFSPLTALFLSDNAPFHFLGFSIMCSGFLAMIAFIQSTMIKPPQLEESCSMTPRSTLA